MIGALCEHYRWAHDFWRRMGWREFRGWLRTMNESRKRARDGATTDPDSWDGKDADPFWQHAARKHRQMRGR